jgi:DNA modification methylase
MDINETVYTIRGDCFDYADELPPAYFDLTFLDPPFNQGKVYRSYDDNKAEKQYWRWIQCLLADIHKLTKYGGSLYFMHREKNIEQVMQALRMNGWEFQNLIIWKKMASAVPMKYRYGKSYQIIVFCTKGKKPNTFNRLRIDKPLAPHQKKNRSDGVFVTDVWDDIRELTSGYYAGDEPLRTTTGDRFHKQQSPIHLLLRIILTSTMPGDRIYDPCMGTGTTLVAAMQTGRKSVGIEFDLLTCERAEDRVINPRPADSIDKHYNYYRFTPNLDKIWGK